MKIVLDLTKLVVEGKLTEAQAQELQALARPATGLLAINILMAFGVFAIAGGVMLLLPSLVTAIALGVLLAGAGVAISHGVGAQWSFLGTAVTIEGALITSAGVIGQFDG
jgi:iron complex transport system permease protein